MKIDKLDPLPSGKVAFQLARRNFVPAESGCYAIATFEGHVLYVGRTKMLRRRFSEHLENVKMTSATSEGRAFFFHWLERDDIEKVERTWMNDCKVADGKTPILNSVDASISI